MAGTIVVDTIQSSTALPPTIQNTSAVEIGTFCRAWVNFNGTGTVAIRASFNVTSITDNGTGDYTVNFTTAMPDANYCASFSIGQLTGGASDRIPFINTLTSSTVRVYSVQATFVDVANACVAIFR